MEGGKNGFPPAVNGICWCLGPVGRCREGSSVIFDQKGIDAGIGCGAECSHDSVCHRFALRIEPSGRFTAVAHDPEVLRVTARRVVRRWCSIVERGATTVRLGRCGSAWYCNGCFGIRRCG